MLPLVLYNGERPWQAPLALDKLIHPAPAGLEPYRPQLSYLLLDEGRYDPQELSSLNNLVAALFRLENSRTAQDIQEVLAHLLDWLKSAEQTGLRRAFTVWINRMLLPKKLPDTHITEFNDLHEVQTMLAETVQKWQIEWENNGLLKGLHQGRLEGHQQGHQIGRQEGQQEEAAKLFLVLLEAKFGSVSLNLQAKIRLANVLQIESWTKQIFQADTAEALLNSSLE